MKKILFATTNEGKMREIRMIMEGSGSFTRIWKARWRR